MGPDWIARGNLWPFLQMLVSFAKCEPGPEAAGAIDRGVAGSSASDNRWHECTFVGERSVAAQLALDAERDLILVKVGVASDLVVEIESLIEICQTYELDGGPQGSLM